MALRITAMNTVTSQENFGRAKPMALAEKSRTALVDIGNKVAKVPTGALAKAVEKDQKLPEPKLARVNGKGKAADDEITILAEKMVIDDEKEKEPVGKAFSARLLNVEDIDEGDEDDPQLVSELVNDIYDYMRNLELSFPIRANYLNKRQINSKMRCILVDWLVQVHERFHLLQETLYLTVAIIDRFLQETNVTRNKLQLVGVTAMFIAAKYEEIYAPEIGDFVYITDNTYTKADIRRTEVLMLKTLNFSLGRPLPLHFLRRNSKAGRVDSTYHTLAKYFLELTLIEYSLVHVRPSKLAAAALCLSMKILGNLPWTDTLIYYSKYTKEDLKPVVEKMLKLVVKASSSKKGDHKAIKEKFSSKVFLRISCLPELETSKLEKLLTNSEF